MAIRKSMLRKSGCGTPGASGYPLSGKPVTGNSTAVTVPPYDESKPGTSLNKCIRFCYELKAGDIAVIVDNNRVAFAYIGEYYEEQSPALTVELQDLQGR